MHEYSCAPQQTVKTALLVKPNPHARVGEKSALSGVGLDPSLRRWLPPVVVKEAKKGWRQRNTPAENAVYLFSKHQLGPVLEQQQRVGKKPPCLVAAN